MMGNDYKYGQITSQERLLPLHFHLARSSHQTTIMKSFTISAVLALAQLSLSAPTPTVEFLEDRSIEKRAAISDIATVGFATLNGGTIGGNGGPTTTVSTLAQYTAAVADDTARVVVVSGTINGPAKNVKIGSNKTIVGLKGAGESAEITRLYVN
jgi:pectate lyase